MVNKKSVVDPSEKEFTKQVIRTAKLYGYLSAHFRPARVKGKKGGPDRWVTAVDGDGKGFPDLVIVHPKTGAIIVAELKVKGRFTAEQEIWLQAFALTGVPTYRWRPSDWPEIMSVLKNPPPIDVRAALIKAKNDRTVSRKNPGPTSRNRTASVRGYARSLSAGKRAI